jgi:hypothetical protein
MLYLLKHILLIILIIFKLKCNYLIFNEIMILNALYVYLHAFSLCREPPNLDAGRRPPHFWGRSVIIFYTAKKYFRCKWVNEKFHVTMFSRPEDSVKVIVDFSMVNDLWAPIYNLLQGTNAIRNVQLVKLFSIVHLFSFSGKTNRLVKSYRTSAPVIHKKTDRFLSIFSTWIQFPRTQTRQYYISFDGWINKQLTINMLPITKLHHMHGFTA